MSTQPLNSEPAQGPVEGRGVAEIRADLARRRVLAAQPGYSPEMDDVDDRLALDVEPLLAEVEAAHRFERSVAVERESLLAEVAELRELTDAARLLGPARRVLDMAAEGEATREECAAMAQRIVDLIGHPVTDEPPHAIVERDSLRGVVQAVDALVRKARFDPGPAGVRHPETRLPFVYTDDLRAALAAAVDAPQPEDEDEPLRKVRARRLPDHDDDDTIDLPTCEHGKTERHTFGEVVSKHDAHWRPRVCPGPSPAVPPEKEQR